MAGSTKGATDAGEATAAEAGRFRRAEGKAEAPLRPAQCRTYMRRELAKEFEGIVKGFIDAAKSGSCQHVKLATELLEPRPRAAQPKSGHRTVARWMQEMERDA